MADPLMEERIITKKKWSKPNSGWYNISQSGDEKQGDEKQENLPKQDILTAQATDKVMESKYTGKFAVRCADNNNGGQVGWRNSPEWAE